MDAMLERLHKNGLRRSLLENYQLINERRCNRTVNKTTVSRRCRYRFVDNDAKHAPSKSPLLTTRSNFALFYNFENICL